MTAEEQNERPRSVTTFANEIILHREGDLYLVEVDDARPRNKGKRMLVAVDNAASFTDYPLWFQRGESFGLLYDYPERFTGTFRADALRVVASRR